MHSHCHGLVELCPSSIVSLPNPPLVCTHIGLKSRGSQAYLHHRHCQPGYSDLFFCAEWSMESSVLGHGLHSHWSKPYWTTSKPCLGPPLPSVPEHSTLNCSWVRFGALTLHKWTRPRGWAVPRLGLKLPVWVHLKNMFDVWDDTIWLGKDLTL